MSFGVTHEKTDILTFIGHIRKEFNLTGTPCPVEGIALLFSREACVYIKERTACIISRDEVNNRNLNR